MIFNPRYERDRQEPGVVIVVHSKAWTQNVYFGNRYVQRFDDEIDVVDFIKFVVRQNQFCFSSILIEEPRKEEIFPDDLWQTLG